MKRAVRLLIVVCALIAVAYGVGGPQTKGSYDDVNAKPFRDALKYRYIPHDDYFLCF